MTERYIGDGLYVSLDFGRIKLRAPRVFAGPMEDHEVYLEPEVYAELVKFVEEVWTTSKGGAAP